VARPDDDTATEVATGVHAQGCPPSRARNLARAPCGHAHRHRLPSA